MSGSGRWTGDATLTGPGDAPLKLSVITSSAGNLSIAELLRELWILRTYAIDLYPRGCDVAGALGILAQNTGTVEELRARTVEDRFGDTRFVDAMAEYVGRQKMEARRMIWGQFRERVPAGGFVIPAIATYFPDIASHDPRLRRRACNALKGAVRLASRLKVPVVEFVLGRLVSRCHRPPEGHGRSRTLRCEYVYEANIDDKLAQVVPLLEEVADAGGGKVRLAAEIEPGYSYLLSTRANIDAYRSYIAKRGLSGRVGLNLDIGHMLILANTRGAGIDLGCVGQWREDVFHAHASDNIGFHFQDLVPGSLHPLLGTDGDGQSFEEWVSVCLGLVKEMGRSRRFSGYISVEIEGCQRNQWVQRSLLRLGYLIRCLRARGG